MEKIVRYAGIFRTEEVSKNEQKVLFYNGVYVGDFVRDVDGFFKFFPDNSKEGYWTDYSLIALGELLEHINSPWDEELRKALDELNGPTSSEV